MQQRRFTQEPRPRLPHLDSTGGHMTRAVAQRADALDEMQDIIACVKFR